MKALPWQFKACRAKPKSAPRFSERAHRPRSRAAGREVVCGVSLDVPGELLRAIFGNMTEPRRVFCAHWEREGCNFMVLAGEHEALSIARPHNRTIHDIQSKICACKHYLPYRHAGVCPLFCWYLHLM